MRPPVEVVGEEPLRSLVRDRLDDLDLTGSGNRPVLVVCRSGLPDNIAVGTHVIFAGRVGSGLVDAAPYQQAASIEAEIANRPNTVIRTTETHHEVWEILSRLARRPVMVLPHDVRYQPIDSVVVAEMLVGCLARIPQGRLDDIGGQFAYDIKALARSFLAAHGLRRRTISLNRPGIGGAALRAGANLTPHRGSDGRTWNEFVASRLS